MKKYKVTVNRIRFDTGSGLDGFYDVELPCQLELCEADDLDVLAAKLAHIMGQKKGEQVEDELRYDTPEATWYLELQSVEGEVLDEGEFAKKVKNLA